MKPEDFSLKIKEVMEGLNDQAKVSTILAELVTDYNDTHTEKNQAIAEAKKLVEDNEKLRQANMNLFLKVGDTKKEEAVKTAEDNTPKFEQLFDEKGNLK